MNGTAVHFDFIGIKKHNRHNIYNSSKYCYSTS